MQADGVEFHNVAIRYMTVAIVTRGWCFIPKVYDDLEELSVHIAAGIVKYASDDPQLVHPMPRSPRNDRREAKAWTGRLQWDTRLKPQAWDDEPEPQHIGGLRDVALSLDKLPGVRQHGGSLLATPLRSSLHQGLGC